MRLLQYTPMLKLMKHFRRGQDLIRSSMNRGSRYRQGLPKRVTPLNCSTKRSSYIVCVCLTLVFSIFYWTNTYAANPSVSKTNNIATNINPIPIKQLKAFVTALQVVKKYYVHPVSYNTLIQNAIDGMVNYLDPHSAYLNPTSYKQLAIETTGNFGGIGIVVAPDHGLIKIISPIDNTPAQKAGIKSGDIIIRVNGNSIQGMPLEKIVQQLRGKPGTWITLDIIRPSTNKPMIFRLQRKIIHIHSVKSELLSPNFGYIKISSFQSSTPAGVNNALKTLKQKNHGPLRGLVLDLRDDPGGLLMSAVSVASIFINHGTIVYTKGRIKNSNIRYVSRPGDALHGAPIVVLINGGTASAAEIVAGALKDNHRALIAGTPSFGKGSVQTVIPLSKDTAIKLTTALYFTPNGHSIQAEGIVPNILIPAMQVKISSKQTVGFIHERNLPGHLQNPDSNSSIQSVGPQPFRDLAQKDFQLYQALLILQGLAYQHS